MTVMRLQVGGMKKTCQNSMWCVYFPTFKLLEIPTYFSDLQSCCIHCSNSLPIFLNNLDLIRFLFILRNLQCSEKYSPPSLFPFFNWGIASTQLGENLRTGQHRSLKSIP